MLKPAVFWLLLAAGLLFLEGVSPQPNTLAPVNSTTAAPTNGTTITPPANSTTTSTLPTNITTPVASNGTTTAAPSNGNTTVVPSDGTTTTTPSNGNTTLAPSNVTTAAGGDVATSPPIPPCPNVTDETCTGCVDAGCAWFGEGECYIDCNTTLEDRTCFSLEPTIDTVSANNVSADVVCKDYEASLQSTNGTGTGPMLGGANASVAPRPAGGTSCSTSADCLDSEFCSSSNKTCVELKCQNWIAGVPEGNISYSEAPCVGEGIEKGVAFCGWDGRCYPYSCDNWYKFGPVEFTGYDPNSPVELVCAENGKGKEENMNSIVFGCRPYQPGSKAPEAKTWTYFFNQECKATPRGSDEFKCYGNKKGTDYSGYLGEVSRLNQPTCDREQEIFTEQPLYWYIAQARQERKGTITNYKEGRENTASGMSFDASKADRTMYAVIVSNDDAPSPPALAPTNAPGSSAIASLAQTVVTLSLCMAAALLFL